MSKTSTTMATGLLNKKTSRIKHDLSIKAHYDYVSNYIKKSNAFGKKNADILELLKELRKEDTPGKKPKLVNNLPVDYYHDDAIILSSRIERREENLHVVIQIAGSHYHKSDLHFVCKLYSIDDPQVCFGEIKKDIENEMDFNFILEGSIVAPDVDEKKVMIILDTFACAQDCLKFQSNSARTVLISNKASELVKAFSFDDPITKYPSHDVIKIAYNRENMIRDYDYLTKCYSFNEGKVSVWLPVQFTIEVKEGCEILGLNKEYGYNMYIRDSSDQHGGMVKHYCDYPYDVKKKDEVIENGKSVKVTYSFAEQWNQFLTRVYAISTNQVFYFTAVINVKNVKGEVFPLPMTYAFDAQEINIMVKKCKPLLIQWGCIAKGSRVSMMDGTQKEIENIQIGDIVITSKGENQKVKNIHFGKEENITVITTQSNKKIMLTYDHPVVMKDGTMEIAGKLSKGMELSMANEIFEEISNVFTEKYNDMVYNLEFEVPSQIFVNGFVLGDFHMQQQNSKKCA